MSRRCPYVGLKDSRDWAMSGPHSGHRCYIGAEPERIGQRYQASMCLRPAHVRCPRLEARGPVTRREAPLPAPELPPAPRPAGSRYTDLRPLGRARRFRLRLFELLIVALTLSAATAVLSLGYAVYYRLQMDPSVDIVAAAAQAVVASEPRSIPTNTFTATPAPTATATPTPTYLMADPVLASPTAVFTLPPPTATPNPRPPAAAPPTRLVIPKIDLDITVKPVGAKQVNEGNKTRLVWGDVPNAGAFHDTSAYPGNSGNTVINGHRDIHGSVFLHLDRVEVGDEIAVYVGETVYKYQVTEVLIVPETFATSEQRAANRQLLGVYPEERLTLITCTPIALATHRLVVVAVPPEAVAPEMPAAGDDS